MSTPEPPQTPQQAAPVCYRHPDRETWISCQRCGRPICPDCMTDAAVGFQCPECVREGRKQTRQAKGAYGGAVALGRGAVVTFTLIGLNVLVWLVIVGSGGQSGEVLRQLWLLPEEAGNGISVTYPGVSGGAYWQLLTSVFSHLQIWHLGVNMLSLYFLGPLLEQALGRVRFLAIYLISGLVGSASVMWFSSSLSPTLGASGAIFGLMGALLVLCLKRGLDPRQILFWLGLNLVITFTGGLNISWQGHVGGLVGGIVVTAMVVYAPRVRRETWQWLGFAVVTVLALAASVMRAAQLG